MMTRKIWTAVAAVGVVGAIAAGTLGVSALALADRTDTSPLAVQSSFPGLPTPSEAPGLASLSDVHPTPGDIAEAKGPFDDRFEFRDVAVADGAVTGAVVVTSDVSDVLDLEVVAGFYSSDGRLIGSDRFVHHLVEHGEESGAPPNERQEFRIAIPAGLAERVASYSVSVPVLVNE